MRYSPFKIAELMCSGVLCTALLAAARASEPLPKVCSPTNAPPCATPPRAVSAPSPDVPQQSNKKGKYGVSLLSIIVEPDGSTSHIRVIKPVGHGLDEKAVDAVKTWKFKPATLNGKPVAVQIAVEIKFHLY